MIFVSGEWKWNVHLSAIVTSKSYKDPLPLANFFIVFNDGASTLFSSKTFCFCPSSLPFRIQSTIFFNSPTESTVFVESFWAWVWVWACFCFRAFLFFLHWTWPMHDTLGEVGSLVLKLSPRRFLRASRGIIETIRAGDRQGLGVGFWNATTKVAGCFVRNLRKLFLIWNSFSMLISTTV